MYKIDRRRGGGQKSFSGTDPLMFTALNRTSSDVFLISVDYFGSSAYVYIKYTIYYTKFSNRKEKFKVAGSFDKI